MLTFTVGETDNARFKTGEVKKMEDKRVLTNAQKSHLWTGVCVVCAEFSAGSPLFAGIHGSSTSHSCLFNLLFLNILCALHSFARIAQTIHLGITFLMYTLHFLILSECHI